MLYEFDIKSVRSYGTHTYYIEADSAQEAKSKAILRAGQDFPECNEHKIMSANRANIL